MGSNSHARRCVSVGALAADQFAAPEHDRCPANTALIPAQLGRVGAPSDPLRCPPSPIPQESFLTLIGELSLRVIRSSHPP